MAQDENVQKAVKDGIDNIGKIGMRVGDMAKDLLKPK